MPADTRGIKNWQKCPACKWEGEDTDADTRHDDCPNCGYTHGLHLEVDLHVWNGRRYERMVRNPQELAEEEARVIAENRPTPQFDKKEHRKNGHQFASGEKPKYKPKKLRDPRHRNPTNEEVT